MLYEGRPMNAEKIFLLVFTVSIVVTVVLVIEKLRR